MFLKSSNRKTDFLFTLVLLFIIAVGVWLRFSETPQYLTQNIASYYYHRSLYLIENGALPQKDIWGFAPLEMPENVPPLLAYTTATLFWFTSTITGAANDALHFYDFVLKSPILFFLLWAISALFLMRKYFSKEAAFIAVLLLTFLPASIFLTRGGKYSEELLGSPLVFFLFLFLLRFLEEEQFSNLLGVFLSAYFLGLAWPQFPAPFFGVMLVAFLLFFFKKTKAALSLSGVIVLSLLLGHAVSIWILQTDYSPFYMLAEAWQGFSNINNTDLRLAMGRTDWANANPFDFLTYFGGVGIFLFALGLARVCLFRAPLKDSALIIFSGMGLAMFLLFIKSSALFLPIFVLVSAYGGEMALSYSMMNEFVFAPARRIFQTWWMRFSAKIVCAIFAGAIFAVALDYVLASTLPKPAGNITIRGLPDKLQAGQSYILSVVLENGGAPTASEPRSFAGLHIEIKDAVVKNMRATSSVGGRVVIKPNAVSGDWYWFETAFPALKSGGAGVASFSVMPLSSAAEIRVRGWLPAPCLFASRLNGISQRSGPYWNPFTEGWRSESCLVRIPTLGVAALADVVPCAVEVFAGYRSPRIFQCERYFLEKKTAGPN